MGVWAALLIRLLLLMTPGPDGGGVIVIVYALLFVLLTAIAGISLIKVPRGGAITVAFALDFACILIFGPEVAAGIAAVSTPFLLRKAALSRVLWNTGQILATVLITGYVYQYAGGRFVYQQSNFKLIEVNFLDHILALILSGVVYVLVNTFSISLAISVTSRRSPIGIWMVSCRWMAGRFLAVAPFGVLMAMLYQKYHDPEWIPRLVALALFFIPLLLARWAFQGSMGMLDVYNQTLQALSNALEAYDPYTRNHSERVTRIAEAVAHQMHLPEPKVDALLAAARLHDMGKCRYDWENIIRKPGRPTDQEWQVIRSHPIDGARLAEDIQVALIPSTADIVRAHHERMDGSGYPNGLKGEEIDLAARILSVADSFEAITSRRAYQHRRGNAEALEELRRGAGTQFDPQVVDALERVLTENDEALAYIGENQVAQI